MTIHQPTPEELVLAEAFLTEAQQRVTKEFDANPAAQDTPIAMFDQKFPTIAQALDKKNAVEQWLWAANNRGFTRQPFSWLQEVMA